MSKEQILKEFDDKYNWEESTDYWKGFANNIKQFISKSIDQTREETIRGVERFASYDTYNGERYLNIKEDILNKLKK